VQHADSGSGTEARRSRNDPIEDLIDPPVNARSIAPPLERRRAVVKTSDRCRRFRTRQKGATVVEYVLMLALIAIVCMAGVMQIGSINALFFNVGNTL